MGLPGVLGIDQAALRCRISNGPDDGELPGLSAVSNARIARSKPFPGWRNPAQRESGSRGLSPRRRRASPLVRVRGGNGAFPMIDEPGMDSNATVALERSALGILVERQLGGREDPRQDHEIQPPTWRTRRRLVHQDLHPGPPAYQRTPCQQRADPRHRGPRTGEVVHAWLEVDDDLISLTADPSRFAELAPTPERHPDVAVTIGGRDDDDIVASRSEHVDL